MARRKKGIKKKRNWKNRVTRTKGKSNFHFFNWKTHFSTINYCCNNFEPKVSSSRYISIRWLYFIVSPTTIIFIGLSHIGIKKRITWYNTYHNWPLTDGTFVIYSKAQTQTPQLTSEKSCRFFGDLRGLKIAVLIFPLSSSAVRLAYFLSRWIKC